MKGENVKIIRLTVFLSLPLLFFLTPGCDNSEKKQAKQAFPPQEGTERKSSAGPSSPQKSSAEKTGKKDKVKKEEKKKTPAQPGAVKGNGGKANEGSGKGQARSGGGKGGSTSRGGKGDPSGGKSGSSASGTGESGESQGRVPGQNAFGKKGNAPSTRSRRSPGGEGGASFPDGGGQSDGGGAYGTRKVPAGWVSDEVKEEPSPDRQKIWNALTAALRELIVARKVVFTPFGGAKTSLTQLSDARYKASGRCLVTDEKGREIPYRFECIVFADSFETKILSADFRLSN